MWTKWLPFLQKSYTKSSKTQFYTDKRFLINRGRSDPPSRDISCIDRRLDIFPSICMLTVARCPLKRRAEAKRPHACRTSASIISEIDWQLHSAIAADPPGNKRMDGWSGPGRLFIDLMLAVIPRATARTRVEAISPWKRSPSDRWRRKNAWFWWYIWFLIFTTQSLH